MSRNSSMISRARVGINPPYSEKLREAPASAYILIQYVKISAAPERYTSNIAENGLVVITSARACRRAAPQYELYCKPAKLMERTNVSEFRSIAHFNNYDKVILVGGLGMAIGTFFPIITAPIVGSVSYLHGGRGDGTIVLALSVAVIVAVFSGYRRMAAVVGFAALVVMMVTLLNLLQVLSKLHGETAHNQFATLLASGFGLEWGWIPLIGGAMAVLGAGLISGAASEKIEGKSVGPNQTDGNGLFHSSSGVDQETDEGWVRNADQKIARYAQETSQRQPTASAGFGKRRSS